MKASATEEHLDSVREAEDLVQFIDKMFPWYMLISVIFLSSSLSMIVTMFVAFGGFESPFLSSMISEVALLFAIFYLTTFQVLSLNRIYSRRFKLYDLLQEMRTHSNGEQGGIKGELHYLTLRIRKNLNSHNLFVWFSWLGLISIFAVSFMVFKLLWTW